MGVTIHYRCNDRFLGEKALTPPTDEQGLDMIKEAMTVAKEVMDQFEISYTESLEDSRDEANARTAGFFEGALELSGPGEGCEWVGFGWHRMDSVFTDLDGNREENIGWNGRKFCKTAYAEDWSRTHLAVAEVIVRWQERELVIDSSDESDYLPEKNLEVFVQQNRVREDEIPLLQRILEQVST